LGLEIAPKVRFMKKGQKQEQTNDTDTKPSIENNDAEQAEDDDDDDWFTIKKNADALEQATIDLSKPLDKEKKLTKAKLAKKLRKKNILINKLLKYDDEGNVSFLIKSNNLLIIFLNQAIIPSDEEDQSATYNIEEAKVRLQRIDKADKEAYRALVKQKHKVCIQYNIYKSI